jgi:hypothetical protein
VARTARAFLAIYDPHWLILLAPVLH